MTTAVTGLSVNLGIGQRHFIDERGLGYHAFSDYNLKRAHRRLGLGGEVWGDDLKLSANVYTPLSDWKDARDVDGYLERVARGFDLNAKYYLPQYPQAGLSGKLALSWPLATGRLVGRRSGVGITSVLSKEPTPGPFYIGLVVAD